VLLPISTTEPVKENVSDEEIDTYKEPKKETTKNSRINIDLNSGNIINDIITNKDVVINNFIKFVQKSKDLNLNKIRKELLDIYGSKKDSTKTKLNLFFNELENKGIAIEITPNGNKKVKILDMFVSFVIKNKRNSEVIDLIKKGCEL
jgi:transcription-repair coupling factor (superfamily II helicase)